MAAVSWHRRQPAKRDSCAAERRDDPEALERRAAGVRLPPQWRQLLRVEPPALPPRCVVCEVELHANGTRLTVRSMLTLINHTRRLLIADLASDGAPLRHLGILQPGATLPIPESGLEGGLRLIDAGASDNSTLEAESDRVASALDTADALEASGQAIGMWLPSLMSTHQEVRPSADEESQWRSLFHRPSIEYLLRAPISCSLGDKAGELYLEATLYISCESE